MAKGKKSEETLAQVRRDRLNKHLNKVEDLIQEWMTDLDTPSPFYWSSSQKSRELNTVRLITVDYRLEPWKLWACRSVYVPPVEQDTVSNHILRKHLRKRALWRYHTEWEQRLNRIRHLGIPICQRATEIENVRAKGKQLTEDYKAVALLEALELALGHTPEKSYSPKAQGASYAESRGIPEKLRSPRVQGVYYAEFLIEKTANAEQVNGVVEEHWQMISELGESKEMLELAQEWQRVLALQKKMIELVQKAIESSDILYPCQFCRRLWQE